MSSAAGRRGRPLVVVTGASGYLGTHLVPALGARADVIALRRSAGGGPGVVATGDSRPGADAGGVGGWVEACRLDLTDRQAVVDALTAWRPDAVIHAAAANPGAPPGTMEAVNVGGSMAVAEAVSTLLGICRLVHVSSDVVHDGRRAPYADDTQPSPLGEYGRTKAAAEAAVQERVPDAAVVRTSLIWGPTLVDRGTEGFLERLERGQTLCLFADVVRQPVWAGALAEGLMTLALDRVDVAGTLNLAGRQPLTRAAFGRRMLEWWGAAPARGQVEEVSAAGLADVALDLRLQLDRADELGLPTPGVDEVLGRCRAEGVRPTAGPTSR